MSRLNFRRFTLACCAGLVGLTGCSSSESGNVPARALLPSITQRTDTAQPDKRGKIQFFPDDYADPVPEGIAPGPDGNLWIADPGNDSIGRMTPRGKFTFYNPGEELSGAITAGPDGALWFTTEQYQPDAFIGRIATDGTITLFNDPNGSYPQGITTGPDGALWFGESNGTIGRITTQGDVTHFTVGGTRTAINSIVTGSDGALWATLSGNYNPNKILRLTTSGKLKSWKVSGVEYICAGPDGALWFTDYPDDIGRITTKGAVTLFPIKHGSKYGAPAGIAAGADGALWFTYNASRSDSSVVRMTTSGKMTFYHFPGSGDPSLAQITAGPLGDVWFTSATYPTGVGRVR